MSPRRAVPQKKQQQGGLPSWVIVAAVVVIAVVAVVIGADFISKSAPVAVPASSGVTSSSRTLGDPKASVTFVEFSDFQ